MSRNVNELVVNEQQVINYVQGLVESTSWILGAWLTGSRVWQYGERLEGEYGGRKKPTEESDWDIIFETKFPVVNIASVVKNSGLHIDATTQTTERIEEMRSVRFLHKLV